MIPSNWRAATQEPDPTCPYCGEEKLVEWIDGRLFYCAICGKAFTVPPPAKPDEPRGSLARKSL